MHVLVTGASSGIGEAVAREFLARDAKVTLVARRRDLLEKIAVPERTHVVTADLSLPNASLAWVDEAEEALGPIDVLVNNAGVMIVKAVTRCDWESVERMLLLDLFVPLRLVHMLLPRMVARKSGTIVDIASTAGIAPPPGMYFYNACKGGLAAASESLRAEVKRHGVHVVTVYPGPVKTALEVAGRAALVENFGSKYIPTGTPDKLARKIYRAVINKRKRIVYPGVLAISRHFPSATRWALDVLTPPLKEP